MQTIKLEERRMNSLSARMQLRVQPDGTPRNALMGPATLGRLLIPMEPRSRGVLPSPSGSHKPPHNLTDSAIHAVTDFTRQPPITVDEERQIDDALSAMIVLGVRALLVAKEKSIVGLITSYDIQGEKPMQFLQSSNCTYRQDIRVGDIMTPWEQLIEVDWHDIQSARVGDLLRTFEETQLTHLVVIETAYGGAASFVRGLISRRRISRQLRATRRLG